MTYFVEQVGCVTPLGPNADSTWRALYEGQSAARVPLSEPLGNRRYFCCSLPAKFVNDVAKLPRLRRSSTISLMGVAAAQAALAGATASLGGNSLAIVYAICAGSVGYTRRFYDEVLSAGRFAPSPLLFSETVFNGPASHLASVLGVDGEVYTLVGDSAIGLSAVHFATELLEMNPALQHCLVVGTEEMNWALPEAFHSWRMASRTAEFEVYGSRTGAVFGEAAAAVLLGRNRGLPLLYSNPGNSFFSAADSVECAKKIIAHCVTVAGQPDAITGSANGTFADETERQAISSLGLSAPVYAYKPALGDALGASAILQIVLACQAVRRQELPGTLNGGPRLASLNRESKAIRIERCLVSAVGFNQQANALMIGGVQESRTPGLLR
jgi:3-oxoacyl-(acyl-carrier-protein) synthase